MSNRDKKCRLWFFKISRLQAAAKIQEFAPSCSWHFMSHSLDAYQKGKVGVSETWGAVHVSFAQAARTPGIATHGTGREDPIAPDPTTGLPRCPPEGIV